MGSDLLHLSRDLCLNLLMVPRRNTRTFSSACSDVGQKERERKGVKAVNSETSKRKSNFVTFLALIFRSLIHLS